MAEPFTDFVTRRTVDHLTVVGRLPGTRWRPTGGIQIVPGDSSLPFNLRPDQAVRLATAIGEVYAEMEAASDERYGAVPDCAVPGESGAR